MLGAEYFSLGAGTGPTVLLLALAPAVFAGLRSVFQLEEEVR